MNNLDNLDLDLDINNYDLQDIVDLFKIPIVFNESQLRSAKIMVLRTHPDKSNLPKEYFLFFTSAYKLLYQIYTFRTGKNRNVKESYNELIDEEKIDSNEDSIKIHVEKVKRLDTAEFNKLFNEHYEKCKIQMEEDQGYDEWFRSSSDSNEETKLSSTSSWDQRVSEINKQKQHLRENLSLVAANELQSVNIGGGNEGYYNLGGGIPKEHSSGVFSLLQYEDLKKAHTETVIPVTHEDYLNSKKFNNVNELQTFRDVHLKSYNYDEAIKQQNAEQYKVEEDSARRAYLLAKQDEISQDMNKKFSGSFFKSILN